MAKKKSVRKYVHGGKVFVKRRASRTSFAKKVPREGVKLRSSSEKKSKKRK
jgi:hypothetical protein